MSKPNVDHVCFHSRLVRGFSGHAPAKGTIKLGKYTMPLGYNWWTQCPWMHCRLTATSEFMPDTLTSTFKMTTKSSKMPSAESASVVMLYAAPNTSLAKPCIRHVRTHCQMQFCTCMHVVRQFIVCIRLRQCATEHDLALSIVHQPQSCSFC